MHLVSPLLEGARWRTCVVIVCTSDCGCIRIYADGPAGRRARLLGTGKDVWEVIAVVGDNDGDAAGSARYLEIPLVLVQAAIAYYGACTAEIDRQIEANEQEAAQAHAAYLAGQAALRR